VFATQDSLSEQLELTVLNIAGALTAIGLSALGMYFSSLLPEESARGRALQALWLVLIVFTGK
jgi:hypothetical protein